MMLYRKIKQECAEEKPIVEKEKEISQENTMITTREIRKIFREELRMVLNELKEVTI